MGETLSLYRPDRPITLEQPPLRGRTIVTIGGSRGIGAAENLRFAQLGARVVTLRRDLEKTKKYRPILAALHDTGAPVTSLVGDITEPYVQEQLLDAALSYGEQIFAVNLNAAGGARGSEADARRLNVEMPLQIVDLFLPHMLPGGSFLYPGSLWSDGYPMVTMLPGYGQVAATKHKAVEQLMQYIDRLEGQGIRLRRISAHTIAGTMMIDRALQHYNPKAYAALKATCLGGEFPTLVDMADAAAFSLLHTETPSGEILYVLGKGQWGYADPELIASYLQTINAALNSVAGDDGRRGQMI